MVFGRGDSGASLHLAFRLAGEQGPCHAGAAETGVLKKPMETFLSSFSTPAAWAALATLIVMEVVLGIDNLIFVSILSNKLPEVNRARVRRIGIGLALAMRLVLLSAIAWLVGLTAPVFDLGMAGEPGAHGAPSFETAFS